MCECEDHGSATSVEQLVEQSVEQSVDPARVGSDRVGPERFGRRSFLLGGSSIASGLLLPSRGFHQGAKAATKAAASEPLPAVFARYGANIQPRSAWAQNLGVKGKLLAEADVRFLLVHHTASSNKYAESDVPGLIRGFFGFHTGKEKGWPDVAYNFFVDKFGTAWEGRTGSLSGAVAGSASGGNQGFSQLVCLIGDYSATAPSKAQEETVVRILSALADRHAITTTEGAEASFVSRGSNRHRAGAKVTTLTINGHRSMSMTSCPGDSAFARLDAIRASVHRLRLTTK
jgi:N-acetylmuramoyl-L-alanine amidase